MVSIWQSFLSILFLCLPSSIDISAFYRQSSHFLRVFSMPVILGWSRVLTGLQQPNVSKCGALCSTQRFGAWQNCRVVVRSCLLSEWQVPSRYELLVSIRFWSARAPQRIYYQESARNIQLAGRKWGDAGLILFTTQQFDFSLKLLMNIC